MRLPGQRIGQPAVQGTEVGVVMTTGQSRAELVADQIRREIEADGLGDGDRLGTKENLRERYGVAPATLNETLKLLTARELVEVKPGPGGGVFVSQPSPMVRLGHKVLNLSANALDMSDCLMVRNALDPTIAAEAARHAMRRDIDDLHRILTDMEASVGEAMDYLHHNWRLHMRMAEITPNAILQNYYIGVMEMLEEGVTAVVPDETDGFRQGIEVHTDLVDAIAEGDLDRVHAAVESHEHLTRRDPT